MRFLFPVVLALAATASARPIETVAPIPSPNLVAGSDCPDAASHYAGRGGSWSGGPLKPHKLTELPPAETYAAVYRLDERGCMVPVLYRDVRAPGR